MRMNTYFIKGIITTASQNDTVLPWTRGARRAAFVAKRTEEEQIQLPKLKAS